MIGEDVFSYLVFNLMGTDLNNVLKTQLLSEEQIVFFTYQILRGLKYLHTSGILHRVSIFISKKSKIVGIKSWTFAGSETEQLSRQ
jgi:hypothetical protein